MKKEELAAGNKAPDFSLVDQNEKGFSLSSFAGKKLLLYFYPKASTPGCTVQACSLRDAYADLNELGVVVAGVSPDKPTALQKFADKFSLNFVLLADPEKKAAEAYAVLGEKTMFGKKSFGIIRSSFLIDEKGVIMQAWYKVKPDQTVPLAVEFLKSKK